MGLPHQVTGSVQKIKLILLDVDGVLTDGRVGLLPGGDEIKFFSIYDGLAIRLAQSVGIDVAFISGRKSEEVAARARELDVETVVQGSRDKVKDFEKILEKKGLVPEEVAYIGDDLPDIPLLQRVGFSAAPQNSAEPVKYYVHYVTRANGGDGAVREVIDLLLKTSGKWDEIIESLDRPDAPSAG
jgi:3-deoxy-D-manno-octulosonate 8-phosphate phosphatase (KDO 8-P phosphatase)